jgi:hypothetical protein
VDEDGDDEEGTLEVYDGAVDEEVAVTAFADCFRSSSHLMNKEQAS